MGLYHRLGLKPSGAHTRLQTQVNRYYTEKKVVEGLDVNINDTDEEVDDEPLIMILQMMTMSSMIALKEMRMKQMRIWSN